jgi:DNA-binding IclR family transcriptional regulator
MSLADLARELDLPKSSAHGLLATLLELRLVRKLPDGGYALGSKVLDWAHAYGAQPDVLGAFNEYALHQSVLAAETVMLAVLDGPDVIYLACRPGTRPLAVNFRVGGRFPACCTSSGKAILSTLGPVRIRETLGSGTLPQLTPHSLASLPALMAQLAHVRTLGHSEDDEETAQGMRCFGAPVFAGEQSEAVAAVAVSVIKASLSQVRAAELITGIKTLAAQISRRLGSTLTERQPAQRAHSA